MSRQNSRRAERRERERRVFGEVSASVRNRETDIWRMKLFHMLVHNFEFGILNNDDDGFDFNTTEQQYA
jgi:hypothetical protein